MVRRTMPALLTAVVLLAASTPVQAATEIPVRVTARPDEWAPTASAGYVAWFQTPPNRIEKSKVLAQAAGGDPFRVNKRGTVARTGGLFGSLLVYAEYKLDRDDNSRPSNIRLVDLATRSRQPLPKAVNSRQEEYNPTISGDWLLFGRIAWKRGDVSNSVNRIILFNRATGELRQLAAVKSVFLSPGQVNGNFATWDDCGGGVCTVFRHDIAANTTVQVPNPGARYQYGPGVASDGTVYFFESGPGCGNGTVLKEWTGVGDPVVIHDFAGADADSLFVFDGEGGRELHYMRTPCGRKPPLDLYKIVV